MTNKSHGTKDPFTESCKRALHDYFINPKSTGPYRVHDITNSTVATFDYLDDAELFVKAHNDAL